MSREFRNAFPRATSATTSASAERKSPATGGGVSAEVELSGCGGVVEDADLNSVFGTESVKLVNRPSAGEFGMADWATGGSGSSATVELSDCEGVAAGADLAGPKLVPRSSTAGSVDPAALIVLLSSILSGAARI